nr:major capsid protein [Rattus norvegicus microvirus]
MSIFSSIRVAKPKRSNFDLSHDVKLTTEFGRLTPFMCMEVMPGDTFKVNSQVFARMAPMLAPIMSRVDLYTHYFFVPNRLLWDKWEEFITGGVDGTKFPQPPYVKVGDLYQTDQQTKSNLAGASSLGDYLGLPFGNDMPCHYDLQVSALPFLAYQRIYDDWYRDQNLEDEQIQGPYSGAADTLPLFNQGKIGVVRTRAWQKDYFTSALPWAQRGPEVVLPIEAGVSDVTIKDSAVGQEVVWQSTASKNQNLIVTANDQLQVTDERGENFGAIIDPTPYQVEDRVIGPTINEFRRTLAVQKWLEASARGGARLIEQIFSHFGVKSSDARLQRAEFLGGGKSPIMISEVLQNSQTTVGDNGSPLGDMAGHGVSAQANHGFKRFFEEHGYVIGIMSIMPKTSYQQGVHRMWTRVDKFDYAWPEFAHLGEQPILQREIDADNTTDVNNLNNVFGYTPRYAEYKYCPSSVHGDFRTNLNFWHLGRIFADDLPPKLNMEFIKPDLDELNRIFAVKSANGEKVDHFWIQIFNNVRAKRPLPYYGTPLL